MSDTAFLKYAGQVLSAGMKLKAVMQKKGLTRARAKCPLCETGFIHGRLAGPKRDLHMACDSCDARLVQ
jgi:hypothetical protein